MKVIDLRSKTFRGYFKRKEELFSEISKIKVAFPRSDEKRRHYCVKTSPNTKYNTFAFLNYLFGKVNFLLLTAKNENKT